MTDDDAKRLRALAERATPGPWGWFGQGDYGQVYLATQRGGRRYVMDFGRWGMKNAQPRFRVNSVMVDAKDLLQFEVGDPSVVGISAARRDPSVYRCDVRGVDSDDARYIAAASPDALLALLDERDALRRERDHYRDALKANEEAALDRHDANVKAWALLRECRAIIGDLDETWPSLLIRIDVLLGDSGAGR